MKKFTDTWLESNLKDQMVRTLRSFLDNRIDVLSKKEDPTRFFWPKAKEKYSSVESSVLNSLRAFISRIEDPDEIKQIREIVKKKNLGKLSEAKNSPALSEIPGQAVRVGSNVSAKEMLPTSVKGAEKICVQQENTEQSQETSSSHL